ncbi:BppU family phage baseplate upper protein [Enterococcus faecalis]|uniref:BppU family phage baseplate upper protein n=1 Tax=Enterococcus TaxID=1350 RepID=UPI001A0A9936|nr:BppU family phage baseplate upper protein [Enterococcus faecalis]EGO7983628.1 BppU family phage baseplate upper protein [Enterococcus faecalis]MDT2055078.1 BppU family phage baseplate upper protein [Enterococcus faecalis]MDT2060695.1 BppU family phage baseplate upper protein [Enterococcus faecalis]MDV7770406.1 BppU family phage baseplate upper protein [Enterococcus faecalis]MDV7842954.1 BppU family phage baseplate upper protein [Enterococcus faecalis]
MANKILNLDFSKDPIMPPIIYGRVGDEKMQTITVKISRRDEIADLSGGIITFEGEPAGGKVKVFDSENVSSNNAGLQKGTFEYTFPSAAFSVEGTYKRAYFSFQKDGKRDTTGDFKIIVKGNADIDAGEAETIITEYNKLVKALNEAYQAALNKMNTDYDDVEKRIEAIKVDLNTLKKQITDILVDAEGRISAIGKTVTDEVDAALEKFKEGNFYTKQEADNRFLSKTENLEIQNKKLTNDDGSGLPLPKGVTSFKELSGYAGFYYLNATVAGTMTDKADLPTEFKYSALYVYQHAIAGTAGAMYQEIRMNSLTTPLIAFRTTSPNSSQNSPFKILATTDSVVNSTDIENGLFVIKNSKISDLNDAVEPGIYSISATGVENKPLPNSGSLIVNKDPGGVRQLFQTERTIVIRQFGGVPSSWTDWKKVAFEKEQPFEAWYSSGTNHPGFKNKSRYNLGPEFSNVGQRLGLPMKSDPLQWNSGRWQATVLRDCKLNIQGTVKYQVGSSKGVLYAYTHIDKGLDEGVGDLGVGSAVGAVGGLNYQNVAAFDLNVTLKKGEYLAFRLELAADKQLDYTQLSSMHITELV